MPVIFEMHRKVEASDIDEMNHVNNVRYLQWVQDASEAHWTKVAEPNGWLEQYKWVAINHFIEYKKPAFLNDSILIKTYVKEHSAVKSNRIVEIYQAETMNLLAKSSSWWCMIDAENQKPQRIPAEVTEQFIKDQN